MKKLHWMFMALAVLALGSVPAEAAKGKKGASFAAAKKRCLEQDPGLAGSELQACVKKAQKAAKKKRVY
jgi:hypothetical protein